VVANILHRNRHSHTQVRTRRMRTADLHRRRGRHWRTGTYLRTGSHFRCRPWEEAEILLEEEVVETRTPFASALPLLFLEMFPQPAALPAVDDVLELTAQAREVMASGALVATLPLISHTIVLAQSPALQRRENMRSSGHTSEATRKLCQPATWRSSKKSAPRFRLKARQKTIFSRFAAVVSCDKETDFGGFHRFEHRFGRIRLRK